MEVKLNSNTGCSESTCPTPEKGCGVCGAWYGADVMSDTMLKLFEHHYEKVYWAEGDEVRFTLNEVDYIVQYCEGKYFLYQKQSPVYWYSMTKPTNAETIIKFMETGII